MIFRWKGVMMKEFEKWDKKEYSLPHIIERGPVGRDALRQRKHAWRTALELVLEWLDYSSEHKEIEDKIYDELENN